MAYTFVWMRVPEFEAYWWCNLFQSCFPLAVLTIVLFGITIDQSTYQNKSYLHSLLIELFLLKAIKNDAIQKLTSPCNLTLTYIRHLMLWPDKSPALQLMKMTCTELLTVLLLGLAVQTAHSQTGDGTGVRISIFFFSYKLLFGL